jgi:hypothetical protein
MLAWPRTCARDGRMADTPKQVATIARYVERRRQAEEAGEPGLAVDLDDVIADESKHSTS